ncbi:MULTISPECIES: cytosine permease [unclassified Amycolatopsis]|uniref:cytosine permease n=1 Tax=unclassified Amycolatopsis TaxID=2618356 RepID=UPI001C69F075|nr:cytosine permease [Amycolatopsis sp. DSM 110486]QYN19040.1 cytosine permease [Amycolatopsis sp. DSM 110486]
MTTNAPSASEHHLESEFEHEPVPRTHRRSLASVSAVWFGFPMVLTNAVFGGTIVYGLGFWKGMLAIVVGNLVLLAYVGCLSYIAGNSGKNFALTAAETFGRTGAKIAAGFLATVVIGWFAFQTGLTGATLNTSLGWNETAMILLAGVLYIAITFIGIRALTVIGIIAAPLFVILAIVALVFAAKDGHLGEFASYSGSSSNATVLSVGAAITIVIAGFADSGTMTADFTRWSRTGKEAVAAAFTAFPVANFIALLVGGLIVAAGAAANPATDGGDFLPILTSHGPLLSTLAVIFVFVNLGSVCTHCLYNGAVGWSQLTGSKMRLLTVILGVIGLVAALAGVWSYFSTWLNLLGIFVPPIGAVLICDQLIARRHRNRVIRSVRAEPFIAWALGSAGAFAVHEYVPAWCEAGAGIVVTAIAYAVIEALAPSAAPSTERAPATEPGV